MKLAIFIEFKLNTNWHSHIKVCSVYSELLCSNKPLVIKINDYTFRPFHILSCATPLGCQGMLTVGEKWVGNGYTRESEIHCLQFQQQSKWWELLPNLAPLRLLGGSMCAIHIDLDHSMARSLVIWLWYLWWGYHLGITAPWHILWPSQRKHLNQSDLWPPGTSCHTACCHSCIFFCEAIVCWRSSMTIDHWGVCKRGNECQHDCHRHQKCQIQRHLLVGVYFV